jgi:CheY-like chemotaxis protein
VSRGAHTVLYIEDNLSNLRLVERLFESRPDVELITAGQGRLGIDLARQHVPALILLDLHLPDINGNEVLEQLRSDPTTAHVPVIMLSADATARQSKRLLDAGADAYLTKPLDVRTLLTLLDETLGRATQLTTDA